MAQSPNQENYLTYYTKKFPSFLQEDFQSEAAVLWQELEQGLLQACRPSSPDFDLLIALIPKLEVFLTVYGPSKKRKEMLATLFLRLLLEERTTTINKVVLIRLILVLIGGGNLEDLRVNWKAIHGFLKEVAGDATATLAVGTANPKGKLLQDVTYLVQKVRFLYPEESVEEVLRLLRQNFDPSFSSGQKGSVLLKLFLNAGLPSEGKKAKLGKDFYEKKVIPELMAFWHGRRYQSESAYLSVLGRIARKYPNIDWSPYYDQLFAYFFNAIKEEFPQKDGQKHRHGHHRGHGIAGMGSRKSTVWFVPDLLVKIMRPINTKAGQEYWTHLERLYKSTLPFIHPENPGSWTASLAEFYSEFFKLYMRRAQREQRQSKRRGGKPGVEKMEEEKEATVIDDREKDEEAGPIEEVDLGLVADDDEEGGEQAKEDEDEAAQRAEEEEEDLELEDVSEEELRKEYLLDDECSAKVIEMTVYVIKNLLYSRDNKVIDLVAKTCRRLLFFRPAEFGPQLLRMLYGFFERSDLSHIGFIKILLLTAYPLLSRRNFKNGLAELPKILDITLEHLTSHDIAKTAILLEFYEVVFGLVPIYHPQDLKENFQKLTGNSSEQSLKQSLNENEEGDFWQFSEDLSDWAIKFFKKFVDLIKHFERKDAAHFPRSTALVVSYRNLHSLIFQSSPRLVQRYIDTIKSYLEDNLQKPPSQYLPDILQPLNLRDANSTLSSLIPLFKQQFLTKLSAPKADAHASRPLNNLIRQSSVSSVFDQYELKITNKETLVRMLTVFQDLIRFSSPALVQHRQDIELILFHCLMHEDHGVFERSAHLVHTILLSLLSVYPTNLGSLNPYDLTKEEFTKLYKKVGQLPKRHLDVEWHVPNDQELKYAQEIFALFFDRNLKEIEDSYLTDVKVKKPDLATLADLMDDMHLKKSELSNVQRETLARTLTLADYTFLGVSQRVSYDGIAKLSEQQKKFEGRFMLEGCRHARERLCDLGNRLIQYTFSNLYIRDPAIGRALAQLVGTLYGEEEQHEELQRRMKTLRQKKRAFELEGARGEIYENRFLMAIHVNIKLQERILGYSTDLIYKDNAFETLMMMWLFSFHPNDEVARLGVKLFRRLTLHLNPDKKNEIFERIAGYTVQFVNERFAHLRDNAKSLEENKTIQFRNNEIIYNNKDTYVDNLLKGVLYNLECLLPYLTLHVKHLFQFIQVLLDVPKTDDATFLLRFARLINGIDFSSYAFGSDDDKKEKEKEEEEEEEKPIIRSNELYNTFEKQLTQGSASKQEVYDKKKLLPHIEEQMSKVISVLNQEDSHWKYQVVAAFTGGLLCKFLPANSQLLSQFIAATFKQLASDHYYLRLFAISALPSLLKLHTEDYRKDNEIKRKPEDFKGLKLSIDDAFKHHFLLKQDYENNYIKDPFVGTLDIYEKLNVGDVKVKPKTELPKELTASVKDKEFLRKLINNLVTDVPSLEEASAQKGSGGIAGLLGKLAFNFKSFIGEFFRIKTGTSSKSKSAQSSHGLFSILEASLLRTLFKYFDGPTVFENTIDLIEEFSRDYNSREKQVIAAEYFYAAFKTFKFWDQAVAEKATFKLAEILSNVTDNLSAQNFVIWNMAFSNATSHLDYRILRVFLNKLLQNPFDKKLSSIQGRYLTFYEVAIDRNGVFSEEIAERFLDILANFKPSETRQVEHIASILLSLLKSYVLNPINYNKAKEENIVENLDQIIQQKPGDFVLENKYFLYRFNRKWDQILQNYAQWARETANPEENKIYFELLFIITRAFYSKKLPYSLYVYYEKTIKFLLQLNSDDSVSLGLNSIQTHKESLTSLSKLLYPPEALPDLISTIEKCLKASNPKVRENAVNFYHYFYYNHVFLLKDKSISLISPSLNDENPAVKSAAFEVVVDLFRLYTNTEIKQTIENAKKQIDDNKPKKSPEKISEGLYILMAIVLSRPYEIEEWTDSVIEYLLANKKYSKAGNEKFNKEFAVKFWDNHKGRANVNEIALSYEVYSELREIGNPSSYFA